MLSDERPMEREQLGFASSLCLGVMQLSTHANAPVRGAFTGGTCLNRIGSVPVASLN
jgi:hypothetical protein